VPSSPRPGPVQWSGAPASAPPRTDVGNRRERRCPRTSRTGSERSQPPTENRPVPSSRLREVTKAWTRSVVRCSCLGSPRTDVGNRRERRCPRTSRMGSERSQPPTENRSVPSCRLRSPRPGPVQWSGAPASAPPNGRRQPS
jgi:hypothetical protein